MKYRVILKGSSDAIYDNLDKLKRESPEGYAELEEWAAEFDERPEKFHEESLRSHYEKLLNGGKIRPPDEDFPS